MGSAAERLRIGLEEAEGDDGKISTGKRTTLPLPWRALCKPSECELPIWCGDYCMPDETVTAALERLGQFLGLPESAFDEAPAFLAERQRLTENHKGTYGPPEKAAKSNAAKSGAGSKSASAMPIAACAAAV